MVVKHQTGISLDMSCAVSYLAANILESSTALRFLQNDGKHLMNYMACENRHSRVLNISTFQEWDFSQDDGTSWKLGTFNSVRLLEQIRIINAELHSWSFLLSFTYTNRKQNKDVWNKTIVLGSEPYETPTSIKIQDELKRLVISLAVQATRGKWQSGLVINCVSSYSSTSVTNIMLLTHT